MSLKAEPETPPNVGKHSEPLSAKCRKLIWFFLIKKNVQYCLLLVVISKEAFLYFLLYIRFFSFLVYKFIILINAWKSAKLF